MKGYCQKESNIIVPAHTKSDEISKSRRVLLDKFLEQNMLGIMLEMDRLMILDDEDYLTLYPIEFWLLSYWLKDYRPILSSFRHWNTDSLLQKNSIKVPPLQDYLTTKLIEKSNNEKSDIIQAIKEADITGEEKEFLLMQIEYLLSDKGDQSENREMLNRLADNFLIRYPSSEYADFTKQFIRVKYTVAKDGFSLNLYSGKFLFTGNLTDYYRHPTLIGMSVDGLKKNWLYQLNIAFGFGRTKMEMPINNSVWPRNSKVIGGNVHVSIGKGVIDNNTLFIAPLVGLGVFGLDPNTNANKEPEYKGGGIKTNIACNVGFISDFKLMKKDLKSGNYFNYYPGATLTYIRIGYDFIATPVKNNFIDYSGTVHKITLGVGFQTRRIQRIR